MGRAEDIFDRIVEQGEAAIDEFIQTRASEELFLDFKRSADHGHGTALHQNDRANFERAVSGFGNSEGGGHCVGRRLLSRSRLRRCRISEETNRAAKPV